MAPAALAGGRRPRGVAVSSEEEESDDSELESLSELESTLYRNRIG